MTNLSAASVKGSCWENMGSCAILFLFICYFCAEKKDHRVFRVHFLCVSLVAVKPLQINADFPQAAMRMKSEKNASDELQTHTHTKQHRKKIDKTYSTRLFGLQNAIKIKTTEILLMLFTLPFSASYL